MNKRIYRKLGISDLDLVRQMEGDFRSDFICEENARLFLANPMCLIFACIENNRVIGFAYGYELNRLNNTGNMLYIHEVSVLPELRCRETYSKRREVIVQTYWYMQIFSCYRKIQSSCLCFV